MALGDADLVQYQQHEIDDAASEVDSLIETLKKGLTIKTQFSSRRGSAQSQTPSSALLSPFSRRSSAASMQEHKLVEMVNQLKPQLNQAALGLATTGIVQQGRKRAVSDVLRRTYSPAEKEKDVIDLTSKRPPSAAGVQQPPGKTTTSMSANKTMTMATAGGSSGPGTKTSTLTKPKLATATEAPQDILTRLVSASAPPSSQPSPKPVQQLSLPGKVTSAVQPKQVLGVVHDFDVHFEPGMFELKPNWFSLEFTHDEGYGKLRAALFQLLLDHSDYPLIPPQYINDLNDAFSLK